MAKRKVTPKVKFNKLQITVLAGLAAIAGLFVFSAFAGSSPDCIIGQVVGVYSKPGQSGTIKNTNTSSGSCGGSSGGSSSSSSSSSGSGGSGGSSSFFNRAKRFDGELSCKASSGKIRWSASWENATSVVDLYRDGKRLYRFRKATGPKSGSSSWDETGTKPDMRLRSELRHGTTRVETESCRTK